MTIQKLLMITYSRSPYIDSLSIHASNMARVPVQVPSNMLCFQVINQFHRICSVSIDLQSLIQLWSTLMVGLDFDFILFHGYPWRVINQLGIGGFMGRGSFSYAAI
ncbi:uncharacterized protein LOC112505663 [Cynara cardunculus var. scolymus]|uniref:uncharacterized protein LOC112505663 n=1 Tax=Cynara cardunculus var. scolymus TaxID=59895 RepID=UPI000D62734B|nr:uncharacterized protein LOC112505663 [Cynara cardunculus var. scolymus]